MQTASIIYDLIHFFCNHKCCATCRAGRRWFLQETSDGQPSGVLQWEASADNQRRKVSIKISRDLRDVSNKNINLVVMRDKGPPLSSPANIWWPSLLIALVGHISPSTSQDGPHGLILTSQHLLSMFPFYIVCGVHGFVKLHENIHQERQFCPTTCKNF